MATRLEHSAFELFEKHRGTKTATNDGEILRKLGEEFGEFVQAVLDGNETAALLEAADIHLLLIDFAMLRRKSIAAYTATKLDEINSRWSV